jgi:Ca2+-transporting ATPase
MDLGMVFNGLTNRRDPGSGLTPPVLKAVGIGLVPVAVLVLSTQLPFLQTALFTVGSATAPERAHAATP